MSTLAQKNHSPRNLDLRSVEFSSTLRIPDVSLTPVEPLSYLPGLEGQFPEIFKLFKQVGMHPLDTTTAHNPYTNQPAKEVYSNIGEHCIAVALFASIISKHLVSNGAMTSEEATHIVERALIHNITKPFEIMRREARNSGLSEEVYTVSAYEKLKPLLVRMGISEKLATYMINAGRETGHNSLIDFIQITDARDLIIKPELLPQKIVHLADDMTFTGMPEKNRSPVTFFFTPWERMLASQLVEKYAFLWNEGLALSTRDFSVSAVQNINSLDPSDQMLIGTYAQLQVKIAIGIARELPLLIDPTDRREPDKFIKDLVVSAIKAQTS